MTLNLLRGTGRILGISKPIYYQILLQISADLSMILKIPLEDWFLDKSSFRKVLITWKLKMTFSLF